MQPPRSTAALEELVTQTVLDSETITRHSRSIHQEILRQSATGAVVLDGPDFASAHDRDLRTVYRLYDSRFFAGHLDRALSGRTLALRFSNRMTRAGGKTTRRVTVQSNESHASYEIAISCHLLFQTFADVERTITVSGIVCHDRLQALQRIFEHELIHLTEMLVWGDSTCSAPRFRTIARHLFGHTCSSHDLVTSRERALRQFRIRVGQPVVFELDGTRYRGIVNRITKRATVLVEDARGAAYSNGRRYRKFYVPLSMLAAAGEKDATD